MSFHSCQPSIVYSLCFTCIKALNSRLSNSICMKILRVHHFFLALACATQILSAQNETAQRCGHDLAMELAFQNNPELRKQYRISDSLNRIEVERMVQAYKSNPQAFKNQGVVHTIPVVFHVVYATEEDNISREQLLDGLRVLNEDFRRLNADATNTRAIFQSVAADSEIEFKMATRDPNGNCTNGVTRTQSNLSLVANDNVKGVAISWPNTIYLNIWVVNDIRLSGISNVLGYAYRPTPNQSAIGDGLVVKHSEIGTIGTASSAGRTLTHEVGHYFNLQHPFTGGCSGNGDGVFDTPKVAAANFGCPVNVNSCTNETPDLPDMVENYMDYADSDCMNMFTEGQKIVMKAAIANFSLRGDVAAASSAITSGITGTLCTPQAHFISDKRQICNGESVQFFERAYAGNTTTFAWQFPGGTPASSSQANPIITYNTAGTYPVTLTTSNNSGSTDSTVQAYILVEQANAANSNQLMDDFEINNVPGLDWSVLGNNDYIDFHKTSSSGYLSSSSVVLDNYYATNGQLDWLHSKSLDVRFYSNLSLDFKIAFARKTTSNTDMLRILVSTDCGQNWTVTRILNGQSMSGGKTAASPFAPNTDSDWISQSVNLNSVAGNQDPIIIRWEFISGGGNNVFIDDINLSGAIGQEELPFASSIELYPNPNQGSFSLKLSNNQRIEGAVFAHDIAGRKFELRAIPQSEGIYTLRFPNSTPDGIYLIETIVDGVSITERIILQH